MTSKKTLSDYADWKVEGEAESQIQMEIYRLNKAVKAGLEAGISKQQMQDWLVSQGVFGFQ